MEASEPEELPAEGTWDHRYVGFVFVFFAFEPGEL